MTEFRHIIDADNAPPRLKGLVIVATITRDKMDFAFKTDLELTAQEEGYLKWFIGETVDKLKAETRPGLIGDAKYGEAFQHGVR